MKFHKKHWNSLLAVSFCCYWLFLILLFLFQNQTWTQTIRESKYTFWMFPTHYKMYTSPPKQNLLIHYHFFENDKKLGEVEIEGFFQELFSQKKLQPETFQQYSMYLVYPRGAFKSIVNSHYYYEVDLHHQKIDSSWSFQDYLENKDTRTLSIAKNQILLAHKLKENYPEFEKANHVKLIFERNQYHISKEYIDENGYDVAYKKSVILELNQNLD